MFGRRSRDWVLSGTFSCINNKDQTQSRTMVNPNRFYTYAYLREDKTPYYIGKGSFNRVYIKHKNISLPKDKSRIIYLKQNLTEEEAFKHEKYMIAVFGRKDLGTGILHNRTDGGDGTSGIIAWNKGGKCDEEWKRKVSESLKGRIFSDEHRKKLSELAKGRKSWNKGKSPSEETRKKIGDGNRGKIISEEQRKKLSEAGKGRKHSEESKQKMRENSGYQKWKCLETGFITNAGNLAKYQRARNIDTSKRIRIS